MGTQMKWYYLMYSRLPAKGIFQGGITFYQKGIRARGFQDFE